LAGVELPLVRFDDGVIEVESVYKSDNSAHALMVDRSIPESYFWGKKKPRATPGPPGRNARWEDKTIIDYVGVAVHLFIKND
jgi:hypothetical protein